MATLVLPSTLYKETVCAALREEGFVLNSELPPEFYAVEEDFSGYVDLIRGFAEGKGLPLGYVPYTVFWLVEHGKYIGSISLRHVLTDTLLALHGHVGYTIRPSERRKGYGTLMLHLLLPKAKERGITPLLITCNEENIGSRKIIEQNGGVYENSVPFEDTFRRRYWIDCA